MQSKDALTKLNSPSEKQTCTLGLSTFSSQSPQTHDKMPQQIRQKLSKEFWWFGSNPFETQMLPYIIKAQCKQLFLQISSMFNGSNKKPILSLIINIKFSCLKSLTLSDGKFLSFEAIAFLNMDNLQSLNVCKDNITLLKSLIKQKWSNLASLGFEGNRFRHLEFCRVKMHQQFKYLAFHFNYYEYRAYSNVFYGDMNRIFKSQTQVKFMKLNHSGVYLQQPKIISKLKSRYPEIQLQTHYHHQPFVNVNR